MFDLNVKRDYLIQRFCLKLQFGINDFEVCCEFCEKRLVGSTRISKKGNAWELTLNGGQFHHRDGDRDNDAVANARILCEECHERFHDWGIIQRWLKKKRKTIHDLPNAIGLQPSNKGMW